MNTNTGVISVTVTTSTAIVIENIYITYIIFSANSPIKYAPFNPSGPAPGAYAFVGLDAISSTNSVFAGSSFTSATASGLICVGNACPSSCVSSQTCTNSGGTISGNYCIICIAGQQYINGNCQARTTQCGQYQYWSGTQCLCSSGYVMVSGTCFYTCGNNAYIFNSQCICLPGFVYSATALGCTNQTFTVINCGTNYVSVNGVCICPSPFGKINNLCLACPANSFVNNAGNCQCVSGYTLSSTTLSCVTSCFPNSTPNAIGQCICNDGYYNQGNQCVQYGNCQNGMIYNGQTCVCPTGQYIDTITGQCTACTGFGQAVQGNTCVCSSTFYPTNAGCAACRANSSYNATLNQCVCYSGFSLVNNQCVANPTCPSGAVWNQQASACQCTQNGFFLVNNVCVACPANSFWTGTTCQCQANFVMNGNICISACGNNSFWNGTACACNQGFDLIAGVCSTCRPNSYYSPAGQTCLCSNGYYGNSQNCYSCDSSCATCWGPATTQCSTCPPNGTLNTLGGCTNGCGSGQFVNANNVCTNCMANCVQCNTATTCGTCATGYTNSVDVVNGNIVTVCAQIPTGTTSKLTLRSYVVGNSVVYQGVALSLMPTAILADGCSICNQLFTVNVASSFAAVTTSIEYITSSQYWFLITFNFAGASFIPSFQFTVQINPIYANYFSAVDMTQKLTSSINPQTIYSAAVSPTATRNTRARTSSATVAPSPPPSSSSSSSSASTTPIANLSKSVGNSVIATIFAS